MKNKLLKIMAVFAIFAVVFVAGNTIVRADEAEENLLISPSLISQREMIDNDYFYADQNVTVENKVIDGNAFIAGKDVDVKNITVNGSIAVAGQDVKLENVTVSGDIFVAGQEVKVETSSAKNLYAAAQDVKISEETIISRDSYVAGSNVKFNANSDVLSIGANLVEIGENAVIRELRGETGEEATIASGANVVENLLKLVEKSEEVVEEAHKAVVTATIFKIIRDILTTFVMALIISYIVSKSSKKERIQKYTGEKIALNALLGLGLIFGVVLAAIIMFITIILIPVGVVAILGYIVMLICATAMGTTVIAIKLLKDKELSTKNIILWSLLVAAILFVVKFVPIVGGLIGFVVTLIGIGTIADLLFGKDKKEAKVEVVETKTEPIVVEEKAEEKTEE